jgi:ubiquinone/menaquinone biosynthesis C-methylase UbiE
MTDRSRARELAAHFSGEDPIWDAFALVLDTDRYLNMGYAPRYLPYPLVDSQTRLATYLGRELTRALGYSAGARLLDVGCGRGGPTVTLAREFGFDVTGVELVAHNARLAREAVAEAGVAADVCRGDVRRLPVRTDSVAACVGVDAAEYVPEKDRLFGELQRVTGPGGTVAVSDLAITAEAASDPEATAAVERFADAWGLAVPTTESSFRAAAEDAGLASIELTDITAHSVGRFGVWVALFQALDGAVPGATADALLSRAGVDLDAVRETVAATRPALGYLRHVALTAGVE